MPAQRRPVQPARIRAPGGCSAGRRDDLTLRAAARAPPERRSRRETESARITRRERRASPKPACTDYGRKFIASGGRRRFTRLSRKSSVARRGVDSAIFAATWSAFIIYGH